MEEKHQLKNLWKELFNDDLEYINWYFENIYRENTTRILKEEEILGMIFENKYDILVDQSEFRSRYLVGVGVAPHRRGEGIMQKLLLESLEDSKRKKEEFVYLTPIDSEIYKKFGFGYISSISEYKLEFEKLKEFKKSYKIQNISKENYSVEILDEIADFYKNITKNYFIKVKRDKDVYNQIFSELFCEDGMVYISRNKNNEINGYMFILKSEDILIKEILFQNKEVLSSLFSIVYGYKNYYTKVKVICAEDSYLEDYFKSDKGVIKTIKNKIQARIISPELALMRISEKLEDDEVLNIYIFDDVINDNEGGYQINKNSIKKIDQKCDLEITISNLVTLTYGFRDVTCAIKSGCLKINNRNIYKILDKIFVKKINYFNQDF
ncbi:GNAT family N-acetyltransferase [Cetobacterium sp. 8H]|uniref:GNAT family N-acetyltransferase n=1 Tax=Cetobacterium sp. 8H TaxID=2759681 RepID=UPI00163D1776|nr:GNAT family N-acetyltransferase [Cetobacterium sp. 8H]MBC2851795.1 GNAT family N-acetyltransferase [Cetobacterium sp. 8H]